MITGKILVAIVTALALLALTVFEIKSRRNQRAAAEQPGSAEPAEAPAKQGIKRQA